MHEYTLAQQLIESLLPYLNGEEVALVRVRAGFSIAKEPLRQAFEMLTEGTDLASAQLLIERPPLEACCERCGETLMLAEDEMLAGISFCRVCGAIKIPPAGQSLEVMAIVVEGERTHVPGHSR